MDYKGYEIAESVGHGKTIVGAKKTSTIQVRRWISHDMYMLVKQFRYTVNLSESRKKAVAKAIAFADENPMGK